MDYHVVWRICRWRADLLYLDAVFLNLWSCITMKEIDIKLNPSLAAVEDRDLSALMKARVEIARLAKENERLKKQIDNHQSIQETLEQGFVNLNETLEGIKDELRR